MFRNENDKRRETNGRPLSAVGKARTVKGKVGRNFAVNGTRNATDVSLSVRLHSAGVRRNRPIWGFDAEKDKKLALREELLALVDPRLAQDERCAINRYQRHQKAAKEAAAMAYFMERTLSARQKPRPREAILDAASSATFQSFQSKTADRVFACIEEGDVSGFEEARRYGWDINWKNESGETALHASSRLGKFGVVLKCLHKGADVNSLTSRSQESPLHLACYSGHMEIAELLLLHGCDPFLVDEYGQTPLFSAVRRGQKRICKILIMQGGKALGKVQDRFGETALDHAPADEEILEILTTFHAKPHSIAMRLPTSALKIIGSCLSSHDMSNFDVVFYFFRK